MTREEILEAIEGLRVYARGERRAPHKPLLLLVALAKVQREEATWIAFDDLREDLEPLLEDFAPPVRGRHKPHLPYWHLRSDGLWEVDGAESLHVQADGSPSISALRETAGRLNPDFAISVRRDPALLAEVVVRLLERHFPESLHEIILERVGLSLGKRVVGPRLRDPAFRGEVMRAYEHRCAVSGVQLRLGSKAIGLEAAHVKWHKAGGPSTVANGLALDPTLHLLLDLGAWTLDDERRVIVSADFTEDAGSDLGLERLLPFHGKKIREPVAGEPVGREFIRWHREPELGGVFRQPARART